MDTSEETPSSLDQNAILAGIEEAYRQVAALIHGPSDPTSGELAGVSSWFVDALVDAVVRDDRQTIGAIADKLMSISDLAFRKDSPLPDWTLDALAQHWMGFSDFSSRLLEADPSKWIAEDLANIRGKPGRERDLLVFLNHLGDPIPLRLSEHAKRVADVGNISPPKANATYNRLVRLARRGLVQRAGPFPGLYELTDRGYRVARTLKLDSLEVTLPSGQPLLASRCLLSFLDDSNEPRNLSLNDVLGHAVKTGSTMDAASDIRLCIEAFLRYGLVTRTPTPNENDAYELLPFGLWFARSINDLRSADKEPAQSLDELMGGLRKHSPLIGIFIDDNNNPRSLKPREIAKNLSPVDGLSPLALSYLFVDALVSAGILERISSSENAYKLTENAQKWFLEYKRALATECVDRPSRRDDAEMGQPLYKPPIKAEDPDKPTAGTTSRDNTTLIAGTVTNIQKLPQFKIRNPFERKIPYAEAA